jgi:hypothetical protein
MGDVYTHTCKLHVTAFHVKCVLINKCIPLNEYISSVSDDVVQLTYTAAGCLKHIMAFLLKQQANSFTWDQEHTVAAVSCLAPPF